MNAIPTDNSKNDLRPVYEKGDDWFDYLRKLDAWKIKTYLSVETIGYSYDRISFGWRRIADILEWDALDLSDVQDMGTANLTMSDRQSDPDSKSTIPNFVNYNDIQDLGTANTDMSDYEIESE